ncbi:class I SAM-dependent methyltransferase [Patescibacteria group bacterium]|nr:class I SAM-dependent methyltransferase [Patescibacteria group bacterium]MBU1123629.1 class I SAM-dependent methyltransferase [Patescibacteria group bacterium]
MSNLKTFLYNLKSRKKRKFYLDLMFPKDDYHLKYFGHQHGKAPRKFVAEIFPRIKKYQLINIHKYFDLDPGTSLEAKELVELISIAKYINAKEIIEVGTFNGCAALNLATNLPESTITTIDLPVDEEVDINDIPEKDVNVTDRNGVGRCFKGTQYENRIRQVFADSMKLDWNTFGKKFDLIFIDGCHHYKYVKKDSENALAHLNEGGIILWHDYGQSEGVSKAVDEVESMEVIAIKGTRFAIGLNK